MGAIRGGELLFPLGASAFGFGGLAFLVGLLLFEGELLFAELAVEGGVGELAGVEQAAGAFGVEGVLAEALGDEADGAQDRVAVDQVGEHEAVFGEAVDGRGLEAVFGAVVVVLDGFVGAAGGAVDVVPALVWVFGVVEEVVEVVVGGQAHKIGTPVFSCRLKARARG